MDWEEDVIRRVMEGAGEFPCVQLEFLLSRLEQHPDAAPAIADAMQDMAGWYEDNAKGIALYLASKQARDRLAEIATPQK